MRIVICAPWFRTLARNHAAALYDLGHEVRVVTTDAQGERSVPISAPELYLDKRLRQNTLFRDFFSVRNEVRAWDPDFALVDDSWDPRFHLIGNLAPRNLLLIHDAKPHDKSHDLAGWQRMVVSKSRRQAAEIGVFSDFVGLQLPHPKDSIVRLPLTSEIKPTGLITRANTPSGFCFIGNISHYKGLDFLLDAWEIFAKDNSGEKLRILGHGTVPRILPKGVIWRNARYSDREAVLLMLESRSVVLPYREASQSGVQVTAAQLGVPTIVTNVGALPEFQPAGMPVVDFGDLSGLIGAMKRSMSESDYWSVSARRQHDQFHSHEALVSRLAEVL